MLGDGLGLRGDVFESDGRPQVKIQVFLPRHFLAVGCLLGARGVFSGCFGKCCWVFCWEPGGKNTYDFCLAPCRRGARRKASEAEDASVPVENLSIPEKEIKSMSATWTQNHNYTLPDCHLLIASQQAKVWNDFDKETRELEVRQ